MRSLTRRFTVAAVAVVASLAMAAVAVAASPHFIGTPTITQSGNSLVVNFKVAGLGNVPSASFTLSGPVTVSSRCYTKSNNKPQAANKQETINVSSTKTFPVRNGQTTGSFTITPLSTLTCPPGQRVVVESVSYNLTLSGQGVSYTFTS
jgi:polyisoprenoid-binding protein YceI